MRFVITGTAGFIGFHVAKRLLSEGHEVIGIDSMNQYYDVRMKIQRNKNLQQHEQYKFFKQDLVHFDNLNNIICSEKPETIIHLAAQAGVRYSLVNPWAYEASNTLGTLNVFETAKLNKIKRVIFASSSSVYGANKKIPFSENDKTDTQISLYGATKKGNEVLAYSYHHLYGIEVAGLRFFTVYGPFGRPDLALFKFCRNILLNKEINVYNNGDMKRDFTYITDIVDGIIACIFKKDLCYELYNLGNDNPVELMKFIKLIEKNLKVKAKIRYLPMQPGDVKETRADITKARNELGFEPKVRIEEGVKIFCEWFLGNKEWLLEMEDAKQ
ncbi:MAG: GDP-mannose 4,6-dehydratase [Ignavibacteria bacterium]